MEVNREIYANKFKKQMQGKNNVEEQRKIAVSLIYYFWNASFVEQSKLLETLSFAIFRKRTKFIKCVYKWPSVLIPPA